MIVKYGGSFDHVDLFILKSLQIDPWVKVVDIAKSLGVTDNDIGYHLNRHVFGRAQVPGFRLKWIGSGNAWAKHTISVMTLMFPEIPKELSRHGMSVVTSVPSPGTT